MRRRRESLSLVMEVVFWADFFTFSIFVYPFCGDVFAVNSISMGRGWEKYSRGDWERNGERRSAYINLRKRKILCCILSIISI